jgi:ribonuclease-3
LSANDLESTIGFRFRNQGLLRQALIHRSFLNEQGGAPLESYERLEFLGDAVLELVVSNELYQRLPNLDEGELTKIRAALVCRESLSQAARGLQLGQHLLLGKGEETTGGRNRDSILAAAFEALVAATYLDRGYYQAQSLIAKTLGDALDRCCQSGVPPENPKSMLQERFQAQGKPAPRYQLVAVEGPDHNPVFTVEAVVDDLVVGQGRGGKKADAERAAASDALTHTGPCPSPTAGPG